MNKMRMQICEGNRKFTRRHYHLPWYLACSLTILRAHTHRAIRSITRKKQQFPCPTTVLDCSFKSFSVMSPTTELGVPSAAYTNEIPSHSNTRQNSDAFFPAHRDAFLVETSMSASMTECKHFSKLNL